jgi:hypothetical protein
LRAAIVEASPTPLAPVNDRTFPVESYAMDCGLTVTPPAVYPGADTSLVLELL